MGGFDPRLSIMADWDLWVRVLAGHEVVRCPELLVGYMRHPGNMHLDAQRFVAEAAMLQGKHRWSDAPRRDAVFGDLLPSHIAATQRARGRRIPAVVPRAPRSTRGASSSGRSPALNPLHLERSAADAQSCG
jgi:hypothetical protein